jgi:hypothetical protein
MCLQPVSIARGNETTVCERRTTFWRERQLAEKMCVPIFLLSHRPGNAELMTTLASPASRFARSGRAKRNLW